MARSWTREVSPSEAPPMRPTATDVAIWVATVGAIGATLWWSLAAPPHADRLIGSDKVAHALAYAVDTLLLLLAVVWRPGRPQAFVAWTLPILLGVATLGAAIELLQATVSRDADPLDWFADLIGIAVAAVVFTVLRRRFRASSA